VMRIPRKPFDIRDICSGTICSKVLASFFACSAAVSSVNCVVRRREISESSGEGKAIKTSSEGERDEGSGDLIKCRRENRMIIGPEGRNAFVVFCSFCEVNSRGISLTGFEVGLGSVCTL